jgi:outer membrane biosynthesis protein TonB
VREKARSTWAEWRARTAAAAEVRKLRGGLLLVETERKAALNELGAAAHRGDGVAEAAARATLDELDRREAALRVELDRELALAGERIRRAKLPVQETMMVLPSEPTPPPDEADPPRPAVVPEPYPPPDEGNPPEPARITEPGPDRPRRED